MTIDDETLMAFADGELSEAERANVAAALAQDEALRRKLAAHQALRARLSASFDSTLDEAVPPRLLAGAASRNVIDFQQHHRRRWAAREWAAMAASLALGVVIGVGAMRADTPAIVARGDGLVAHGALARALDVQLAADPARDVRIGLSFRTHDGSYCRTFELTQASASAVACRHDGEWRIALATASALGGEVRMAGAAPEVLAVVDAMIEGEPLDARAEAGARANDWR
jgi:hypothetical protein